MRALLIFLFFVAVFANKNFSGFSVYKLWPSTEDQVKLVTSLDADYDVWAEYNALRGWAQVMIPPDSQAEFMDLMRREGVRFEKAIPDVQAIVHKNGLVKPYHRETRILGWDSYHDLEEINAWLEDLQTAYPENVKLVIGGQSFEERQILGVKLSFGKTDRSAVIEGGIHSREWISPAAVTYVINEFVTSTDPAIRDLAETFDWHIFPVTNPDGYIYTFTDNRLWRKNRSSHYLCNEEIAGVDLNRNFYSNWMEIGASANPCTETHAGARAFSEPESRTFGRYVSSIENLDLYLSIHSFSQLLIIPYGHTAEYLDNYPDSYEMGVRAADALYTRYNTSYLVGNSINILYPTSGGSRDWAKGALKVPVVWTYELRDQGQYGFLLPEEQIMPNNLEFMDSLLNMLENGRYLNYFSSPNKDSGGSAISGSFRLLIVGTVMAIFLISMYP